MFRRPRLIALLIVLLLVLGLFSLPKTMVGSLKMAIGSLFLPLFGLKHSGQVLAAKAAKTTIPRDMLLRQLEELEQENQVLQIQSNQFREIQLENDRLRDMLTIPRQHPWNLRLARVIGRDPANWWRSIHIDLGWRDGLRPNLPVLTSRGLVGRVDEVGFRRSQVVLVGDAHCRVAAMILDTREGAGIMMSANPDSLDDRIVELTFISRNCRLRPGLQVITSGQGGLFPKGIPIGRIVDFRDVGFGLYQEARVKLEINGQQLEEVWVILP